MTRGQTKISVLSAILCLAILFGTVTGFSSSLYAGVLEDGEETITYVITGDVYYGDVNSFKNPAVLKRSKVFNQIPAVKTIKKEKLDKNSARYAFLIDKANRVFRETVEKVAKEKGFDLVVERGGIKASKNVRIPDITAFVIKAIPQS